jgi:hypothetical protein
MCFNKDPKRRSPEADFSPKSMYGDPSRRSFNQPSLNSNIMAFSTAVNGQITDSVTQVNTEVLGDAPSMAMGNFFVATGQALSNSAHNATTNQQQVGLTSHASTTRSVSNLYCTDSASTGVATTKIFT